MKDFNLITEKEKKLVHDNQLYNRIVREELDKKFPGKRIISERAEQLMKFRDKIRADKKALKIKLRSEALNILENKRREIQPKFLVQEMIGAKIYNLDGSIAKKHKEFFDIPTEEIESGTSDGIRIYYQINCSYTSVYLKISIRMWRNHVSHDEVKNIWIYGLEEDKMTIKEIANFEENEFVSLARENRNAKKYMEYLKKSEKKLEELKKACNPYMLETIMNNQ